MTFEPRLEKTCLDGDGGEENLTKFCICIDIARSRLGLLHVNYRKFISEIWPLINDRIWFPLMSHSSLGGW